jgi:hypothetical protein
MQNLREDMACGDVEKPLQTEDVVMGERQRMLWALAEM